MTAYALNGRDKAEYRIVLEKDGETIFDRTFDGVHADSEAGVIAGADPENPMFVRHRYNGHERMTLRAWSGCESFDDFQTDAE